jgi:G3E family GTPase
MIRKGLQPMNLSDEFKAPTPVTILTGFLGAGKTTLLNRIIHGNHGLKITVLVNDFGAINIDTELIVSIDGESVSLSNGCICCTIRDDLLFAVLKILRRPNPPDYIVIEASGISDPIAIAATFLLPDVRHMLRLESILTVVDAEQVRDMHEQYPELITDQIHAADFVIVNKIDLVDDAQRVAIESWVKSLVPRARIFATTQADVPLSILLGVGKYRITLDSIHDVTLHAHEHAHDHGTEFMSSSYSSVRPLRMQAVRDTLKQLPVTIMRAKGLLYVAEVPDRRVIMHIVGRRISLTIGDAWGDHTPCTQIVFISAPNGMDIASIDQQFDACHASMQHERADVVDWNSVRSAL